ncbi:NACHT domain-containing protein [Microbacterium aurugineum]|uniref:NACHT domain-containing protein n=2 Tax=Microbacterium aurugineum TaxID=2851642 RepID=A0ABY4IZ24_9MICO|nr:NACHT domain-containing protein [Microbacterium aurugineum]
MDPIIAVFLQAIDLGVSLAGEARARKGAKDASALFRGLRSLDSDSLSASLSKVRLAGMLGSTLKAQDAKRALANPQLSRLVTELIFVSLVAEDKESADMVKDSLRLVVANTVRSTASQEDANNFGLQLASAFEELCVAAAEKVIQNSPDAFVAFQQTGLLRRATAILQNISDHHEAVVRVTNAATARERDRFISDYRKSCAEKHGYITPPDFKTSRKLPMEQLYVPPRISSNRRSVHAGNLSVEQFMTSIDRTVVLGDPGGGKSTLSGYIASRLARDKAGPVPFHVVLREFAAHGQRLSIVDYIEHQMGPGYEVKMEAGVVRDLLLTGKALVIFDGLDELLNAGQRREMQQRVELFSIQYPHAPVLVTSRRVGYEQAQLDGAIFSTYHLGSFEQEQVAEYAVKWFSAQDEFTEQKADERATAFVEQSAAVLDLRRNPLMLSLMCILFRGENYIPKNRPDVYSKCATLLFDQWDGTRGIEVPLQARDHVDAAMKYIAFEFLQSDAHDTGITERVLVQMMSNYLYSAGALENEDQAEKAAREFVDYCSGRAWVFTDAGSTGDGEPIYTFTHRTFMEYFAAVHLTRITDTPEALASRLLPQIAAEEWDVVAQLAVQQVNFSTESGSARALAAILKDGRKRTPENRANVLYFVVRCLAFAIVPVSLVRQIATACVSFALTTKLARRERHEMRPLLGLRVYADDREASIAAQQVQDDLSSAITDPATREISRWILLRLLLLSQTASLAPISPVDPAWETLLVDLAHQQRNLLVAEEPLDAPAASLLAWHGVLEDKLALEIIRDPALPFWARYFEDDNVASWSSANASGSRLFIKYAASTRTRLRPEQHAWVLTLASAFLEDFSVLPRVMPGLFSRRVSLRRNVGTTAETVEDIDIRVADAALLSVLGNAELIGGSSRHTRERTVHMVLGVFAAEDGGSPLEALKAFATAGVRDIAEKWEAGEVSIFHTERGSEDVDVLFEFSSDVYSDEQVAPD